MNAQAQMSVDAVEFLNGEMFSTGSVDIEKPLEEFFDECLKFISVGDFHM